MQWSEEARDGAIIACPVGRVDESTAQAFVEALVASVDRAAGIPAKTLVLDLAALEYMSSRGLRALTLAKRKADGTALPIILAAPNAVIREILAISRYDKLFTVVDTVAEAL